MNYRRTENRRRAIYYWTLITGEFDRGLGTDNATGPGVAAGRLKGQSQYRLPFFRELSRSDCYETVPVVEGPTLKDPLCPGVSVGGGRCRRTSDPRTERPRTGRPDKDIRDGDICAMRVKSETEINGKWNTQVK